MDFLRTVMLSLQDDEDSEEADVTEDTTQDCVPTGPMATSSEISLSQSAWDDETPGPSYSTLSHPQTEEAEPEGNQLGGTSSATEQREHNDDNDEEEECMIVGYVKPMAERTPELVQLSSDSTEDEGGDKVSATETVMKAETSLPSQEQAPISPKPYPSTSHTERGGNLEQFQEQDAGKHSHHRRKEHTPRRGFRKPSHSLSGSHSQTSSESSPQSGHSIKIRRSHTRLSCREPRRQGHHLLGRSPTVFAKRDDSSSEELVPTRPISTRDKSSKSFSPWDSPSHDGERKKKRRKRRRERETERSRSPHWESRHRHSDRELWLHSSSSDADSRREKPAGKRKYKTRHLERTARRRNGGKLRERERERERSPSVEIIFERRGSNTHLRARRHKKRSRRKERVQNSPTVITIDSDSSSDHTAGCQNRHTKTNSHTADYRHRLMDDDKDDRANDHTIDYQDNTADDNEPVTDISDHTIDYQERLAEFSDRTTDDKDCNTDGRNCTNDYKNHISDQNCGTVFSDRTAEYKDCVAGFSSQTSDYKDKITEVGDYTTDYKHGVQKVSDQAAEHRDHAANDSIHAADYKHGVTEINNNRTDYKDHVKVVSGYTADSKCRDAELNDRTTDYQESLLDVDNSPDDFQDSVTDIRNRGEPNASVLDMLNLEHCLVDVVQPIRRVDDDSRRAASPLSDTRLLDLEDSLLGEGQGMLGNVTMDQQEVGLVAHRDQAEAEMEHTYVTRDSWVSAEMSPDV